MKFYTVVPLSKGNLWAGLLFSVVRPHPVVMPISRTSRGQGGWLSSKKPAHSPREPGASHQTAGDFFIFWFYTHKIWPIRFDKNMEVAQNWRGCFYCDNCQLRLESPVRDRSLQEALATLIKSLSEHHLWVSASFEPVQPCSLASKGDSTPLWSACGK